MNGVLIIVWLCAAIAVLVFAAMIVSIVTFGRPLRDCPPASVSGKATEILWALIPIAIVLAAAMPALRTIVSPASPQAAIRGREHAIVGSARVTPPTAAMAVNGGDARSGASSVTSATP
jgi:heme/copper-type cytochrome/quinol oxidase subunit 2